jgi:hypothetical protein
MIRENLLPRQRGGSKNGLSKRFLRASVGQCAWPAQYEPRDISGGHFAGSVERPLKGVSKLGFGAGDLHGSHLARAAPSRKRNLVRLRKQKLLRQVFERLQDRLLCTFLKAD